MHHQTVHFKGVPAEICTFRARLFGSWSRGGSCGWFMSCGRRGVRYLSCGRRGVRYRSSGRRGVRHLAGRRRNRSGRRRWLRSGGGGTGSGAWAFGGCGSCKLWAAPFANNVVQI